MKYFLLLLISFMFFSCWNKKSEASTIEVESNLEQQIDETDFQHILDSSNVKGSVLIYDNQEMIYYSNDFEWAKKGNLPASTFKIANSIIALESGVVENEHTLFKWDGKKRALKNWEQDLVFRDAFQFSCVPCYQEIARKIGAERMIDYLAKLNYGDIVLDSTTIDIFWLEGESKISQYQQIDFLKRFYDSQLPITDTTESIMRGMMQIEDNEDYILSGKTGWSIRNGNNNGWFVGYIEKDLNVYFFATNVEPEEAFNMDLFGMIRQDITMNALRKLEIVR